MECSATMYVEPNYSDHYNQTGLDRGDTGKSV